MGRVVLLLLLAIAVEVAVGGKNIKKKVGQLEQQLTQISDRLEAQNEVQNEELSQMKQQLTEIIPRLEAQNEVQNAQNEVQNEELSQIKQQLTEIIPRLEAVENIADNIHDCDSNPCQNGGACIEQVPGYVCICNGGATGVNCENSYGCVCNDNQLNLNLALKRPAYQSSTYHDATVGNLSAGYATDGSRVTTCLGDKLSCAHTLKELNPWWAVDLGSVKCVVKVTFINRGDSEGESSTSNDFIIGLTNHFPGHYPPKLGSYTLCGQRTGKVPWGATVQLQCAPGVSGRYVIVQIPREDHLMFGELEVYGCGI